MAANNTEAMRAELLRLEAQRKELEGELTTWEQVLTSQGVGLTESLVDKDGFPRADLDIYQIRTARNKVITIQNDIKSLTKVMETKLFALHDASRASGGDDSVDRWSQFELV